MTTNDKVKFLVLTKSIYMTLTLILAAIDLGIGAYFYFFVVKQALAIYMAIGFALACLFIGWLLVRWTNSRIRKLREEEQRKP